MEKLEHELWIVQAVNAALGPMVRAMLHALGRPVPTHGDVIPDFLVMAALIVAGEQNDEAAGSRGLQSARRRRWRRSHSP